MKLMGRTSDQATLLLFGFLRTVSALASAESKVAVPFGSTRVGTTNTLQQQGLPEITLRLARRTDVPSIQRCNLASLPENYNAAFYASSLRQWPELALVAECTSEPSSLAAQNNMYSSFPTNKPEANIVAYVIGKVEEHSEMLPVEESYGDWGFPSSKHVPAPVFRTTKLGHVTSLAVLDGYRRKGLAQALMEQLHYHMATCYPGVKSVGLHVRQSNVPAEKLYQAFGYEVSERISAYYQDGEDAFLMKKRLAPLVPQNKVSSLLSSLRRSKPWENGDEEYRLPRLVGRPPAPSPSAASSEEEQETTQELLTGTM